MLLPLLTTLTAPLLATAALARGGDETTPPKTDLGRALEALAHSFDGLDSIRMGGLLRGFYDSAEKDLSAVAGENVQGFRIYDAQLWFNAKEGRYELYVRIDGADASAFPPIATDGVFDLKLLDAWVKVELNDQIQLYVGQYKCPLVASGNVGEGELAMIDRTRIGQLFAGAFQPGVALTGDYGQVHLKLAFQNGADSISDGNGVVARGEYMVGEGAKQREGALGSKGFNATFGLGYFKDTSTVAGSDFGSATALDAYATLDQFSLQAEIFKADEEFASRAFGNLTDDATAKDATLGFLFSDDFEGFLRYQDLDNEVNATIAGVGLNYYVSGHATKWQVNVSKYDDDNIDGTILQAGLVIGHSEPY